MAGGTHFSAHRGIALPVCDVVANDFPKRSVCNVRFRIFDRSRVSSSQAMPANRKLSFAVASGRPRIGVVQKSLSSIDRSTRATLAVTAETFLGWIE
ncbi:MAG TPA: hypothetical protein VGC77_11205 [Rhodopseudomonas sp.]|uniref:hypothetical protein n=1 Tax=Rhodopseudomonas sp. TaxID=1078 RepID=UPI002EDBAA96